MNNQFQTINKSELEDFSASCQRHQVDSKDFKLQEHDVTRTPTVNGLYHPHGKVTISKNGKIKTYLTGHESRWPAEFDIDLEAGTFN